MRSQQEIELSELRKRAMDKWDSYQKEREDSILKMTQEIDELNRKSQRKQTLLLVGLGLLFSMFVLFA